MIDSKLRKTTQGAFDIVAKWMIKLKLSANTITIIAFVVGIICAIFVAKGWLVISFFLLWLSGLMDVLDGSVARLTNKSSKLGAYLDLVFDRLVEIFIIIGFAILMPENMWAYILFLAAVIFNFTTFVLAGALIQNTGNKSMHYDVGIAERTETFIVFSLMMLFSKYAFIILMVFNVIILITGIIRFIKIAMLIKDIK